MVAQDRDLLKEIEQAAVGALRNQKRSIAADRKQLRTITLEINLRANGAADPIVSDADCYIRRNISVNRILDVRG